MHVIYIQREVEREVVPIATSRHAKIANGKIFIYIICPITDHYHPRMKVV